MTKSPTEAELVGLANNVGMVELFEEFICFITNRNTKTPTIYQDCTAVVRLVNKGGGVTRTKHLRARINLAQKAIDEGRIKVEYIHNSKMRAKGDEFTKNEANICDR